MTESEMLKLMRTGANRIDAEKFGSFIAKRRRDGSLPSGNWLRSCTFPIRR
jgi:hypothetical protein